jgi:hypothetical protein
MWLLGLMELGALLISTLPSLEDTTRRATAKAWLLLSEPNHVLPYVWSYFMPLFSATN